MSARRLSAKQFVTECINDPSLHRASVQAKLLTLARAPREGLTHIDCDAVDKSPAHKNGYIKVKTCGANDVYLHQLAIIASGDAAELIDARENGNNEVSHLCHDVRCINRAHLCVEPREVNKSRNFCVKTEVAGRLYTNCSHTPRCILLITPFHECL